MAAPSPIEVGFYGKLPSHGDFLRRRVPDDFVSVWDRWLQECLLASRTSLADRWLDVYLTSPAWRFVAASGALGRRTIIGLMVPSVDRVGRYFHLTFAAALPHDVSVVDAAEQGATFLNQAEQLAVETLAATSIDFDRFDRDVRELADHLEPLNAQPPALLAAGADTVLADAESSWRIGLDASLAMGQMFRELCAQRLSALYDPCVLWWTEGSEFVQPTCLLGKGLPRPESFAALLDGAWFGQPWQLVPGLGEETAQTVTPTQSTELPVDLAPPSFRSTGKSDIGRVRSVNQDSFLDRADIGLWVVADGVGGLSQGEVASRMVCDSLADLMPDGAFEALVDAVGERLSNVNAHLIKAAERDTDPVRSGSTVVVLLTRGTRYVVLWAGDSRVYRMRGGVLEQLTRDHSESEIEGPGHGSSAVTRAVGGETTLSLDSARGRVSPGDRFLLCSDGLTRIVALPTIEEWMAKSDLREAAEGLVAATLAAGAPDNVTVVLVEAYA
jgi:type VI secretion system protein ImpM